MEIANHRFVDVEFVPTSKITPANKGGIITPKFIVMHYTAGYTTRGDVNTLTKSLAQGGRDNVSAHLVVGRDAEVVQMVPFNRKAWHAGPSEWVNPLNDEVWSDLNRHSIGIEISNAGWLQKLRTESARARYIDAHGNYIYGDGMFTNGKRSLESKPDEWLAEDHAVVGKRGLVWEPFYEPQLAILDDIVPALLTAYPSIEFIVSHEEIDTRGWKSDPGPAFPMRRYTKLTESRADDGDEPSDE